mmetsp:Transcript_37377/g.71624  ORF Transcript_37377/g.71624 Transcript_37377/m.71624 type:complete len:233 (+) Transcript_37377:84-782(+)
MAIVSCPIAIKIARPKDSRLRQQRALVAAGQRKSAVAVSRPGIGNKSSEIQGTPWWLTTGLAAATLSLSMSFAPPSIAIFNSGDPITDPQDALAAVLASRQALDSLKVEIKDMSKDCVAPTYNCDLSQLLKKSSGRISGPMGRSLPAIINELGADPYAADDVSSALLQAESIMKSNNARVAVDWKGPVDMLNLADASLTQLLEDLEPADVQAAKDRVAACDPTVDPREAGGL